MTILAWTLTLAVLAPPAAPNAQESRLAALVAEVRSADYRGDRAALARLDEELGKLADGPLSDYRDYWRGFALWRRVLNGFKEKPMAEGLGAGGHSARR